MDAGPSYPYTVRWCTELNKARQWTQREIPILGHGASELHDLGSRNGSTRVTWHGRTLAPALPLSFMVLGTIRPSSGIMWQLGIKACSWSCMIQLAIGLNPSKQAAFKTEEVLALPLI